MRIWFWVLLFMGLSATAHGQTLGVSFGPSMNQPMTSRKAFQLSYEVRSWGAPSLNIVAGVVTVSGDNAQPSFYLSADFGIHLQTPSGLVSRIGFGPSYFSRTNDRLSSKFEFHIQGRIGLHDKGFETGLQFDHFSNAGIVPPNPGLDLMSFYVGIPL